jgi:hypothetical protein
VTAEIYIYIYIYILLTAIGLIPGDSVYKDHTFNKEAAPASHENSTVHRTNFHSTIQVHEHYKTQHETENTEELNPGRQAYSSSLHSLSYPDPGCKPTSLRFTSPHFT